MQYQQAVKQAKTLFTKLRGVISVFGSTSDTGEPIIVVAVERDVSNVIHALPVDIDGIPVIVEVKDVI